ncbi:MAG: hypothetical protein K8H90_01390, partial [Thermoanaerobaculia bacterium]|nr:hypothetical protein [Thermoanaerobaculia bacterium]
MTASKPTRNAEADPPEAGPTLIEGGFELLVEGENPTLVRRFFTTQRHFIGLIFGGLRAHLRSLPRTRRRGFRFRLLVLLDLLGRPFLDREQAARPFPVQLRKRLETLGPTYIKLGQILSLREDILPAEITSELKNLLDRLPAVPYERFRELVSADLGRDVEQIFAWIEHQPVGSASIGQVQRARLHSGEEVILKLVKPGIRETLRKDVVLLRLLGFILQIFLARLQPKRVINEFCHYTLREVDLRIEADNAETFAANFKDQADIVFPKIYRDFTTENVLCMEFFDGFKPNSERAKSMPLEDKER